MPAGQPRASREALKGARTARTAAARPQSKAQPVQPAASNQLSGGAHHTTQQPAPAEVAFTPTSQADCGAQISGQQAAMLSAAALPASTASSCQPASGAAAAVSSCAQATQQRGGGPTDATSPPAASAAPAAKGGGRRRAAATVGKKRERDDPLCKAIERYLVAKTKDGDGGEDTPPSAQAQAQRVTRPRPSAAGRTKSASTSGTGDSASPLNLEASARASAQQQQQAGRALPHKLPQLHPKASTLSQGMDRLQLVSPLNATGAPAAGAAAASPAGALHESAAAGAVYGDGALESAILTGMEEATAAVFAPLATLQQHFASAQEQFVAQFGAELGPQVVAAAELCAGNPWGTVPAPLAPLTQQELEEARRQLAATARPFPPEFKWVSPMPLTEEYFGAGAAAASAGAAGAAGGSSGGGGGSRLAGGTESGGGSGAAGGRGTKVPGTTAKRSKHVVPPYRLPAPVGGGDGGSQQAQQQRSGGSGGGRRYGLRTARTKRRRDSGYMSLDSDLSSGEEDESDIEYDEGEDEAEELMQGDSEDESEASRAQPAARQQQAAAAGIPSDALVRVTVTGATGARAGGTGRSRGRPPGSRKQQPAAQRTSAAAAAGAARSAAAAAGPHAGSITPKVPTLGATGLSPLLSPTLASLFMPADQAGSLPGPAAPIDLNNDLDHVLGDLDFTQDLVLHPQPPRREPSSLLDTAKAVVEAVVDDLPPADAAPMVPQSALALAGSWPAAAVAAAVAARGAPLAPRALLNPPLLSPPGGPLLRAASAPAIPTAALTNLQQPRLTGHSASCSDFASAAPSSSAGPCVSIGTHMDAAAAAPPSHAPGADVSIADVAAAAAALGMPHEKVDLAQVLGVKRSTPVGSPLLQSLMSPTALGQFFESWDGSGLH